MERSEWFSLTARPGALRLYAQPLPADTANLWRVPNLFLRKLSAPAFTATVSLTADAAAPGETFGLVMMGLDYAYVAIRRTATGYEAVQAGAKDADKGTAERVVARVPLRNGVAYLRVAVSDMAAFDNFYRELIAAVPLKNVSSHFAMERVKSTTAYPVGAD